MNIIEKRDNIHNCLYYLDEQTIDELFSKVKSSIEDVFSLSQEQEKEIENRVSRHKNGESKSFSWQEVRNKIVSSDS